jgi:addiction module HigA family antidote
MLLEEFVIPLGVTQNELAERLGISRVRLSEILRQQRSITPDTALRLERVLGMSADFWLSLQMKWDLWHAQQEAKGLKQLKPLVKV